ncbi:MAG: tail fiber domain-containing protein [Flavobacteriales bacterium]|nr:tail fiber domain-containing protein [Flavobacteriales bacterium]
MKQIKQLALGACLCAAYLPMQGQVTQLNNTVTLANQYIGCDVLSNQALRFTTQLNFPHEWRTNNILRMQLNESLPGQPVNNFPNVDLSGHLGIGAPVPPQALSFLHINNNGSFFAGFRPWMRTGVSMSENTDWMYVGAKHQGEDLVDAVINWGDNKEADPTYGPDALRFIFTRTMSNINIASQMDGLELARIIPDPSGNQGYFGIGDYFTAATNPSERLDVLNGRVAIRQLPTDPVSASMEAVVLNTTTGVLEHRPFPTTTGGPDCDWTPIAGAINELRTANAPAGTVGACPDQRWKVQIGTPSTAGPYRLTVGVNQVTCANCGVNGGTNVEVKSVAGSSVNGSHILVQSTPPGSTPVIKGLKMETLNAGLFNYGIEVDATNNVANNGFLYGAYIKALNLMGGTTAQLYGLRSNATATAGTVVNNAKGVWGSAGNGIVNYGLYGDASGGVTNYATCSVASGGTGSNYGAYTSGTGGAGTTNFGVRAIASSTDAAALCYGVYGSASGPDNTGAPNGHSKWAGYFPGYTYTPGMMWSASDEQLKQNIEDLPTDEAMNKLQQLTPKTYDFDQDQFGFMHLPTEHQYGLIAQEMEAVLPELVTTIHQPAMLDSAGAEESPAIDFKAMNYQGLIPLLIAASRRSSSRSRTYGIRSTNVARRKMVRPKEEVRNKGPCPRRTNSKSSAC